MADLKDLKADTLESVENLDTPKKRRGRPSSKEEPSTEDVKEETASKEQSEENNNETEEGSETEAASLETPKRGRKRKIDEMSPSEQVALHAERNTYAVQKADKESRRELYSSEHVFVEDGEEEYIETDSTIKKEEWLEIVASASEDRPLKGIVVSVTEIPSTLDADDPNYIPEYMAKVRFKTGNFQVNIPSYVFYHYDYASMTKAMASDIQRNMMRRIGSEVDFVVRYVEEKTGYVIGDRLSALSMRGVRNYTSINGRKPNIIPGQLVQAKIIAMARDYIMVDAAGAEIRIPLEEVSWLFMTDARDFDGIKTPENYKVGSRVNVKILDVELTPVRVRNSRYTLVKASASIKQAKPNPRLKYYDEFKEGDIYAGTVTGITESGVYVILDNKMDCLCKFPKDSRKRIPVMGDGVVVTVTGKDDEKKFIFGKLM